MSNVTPWMGPAAPAKVNKTNFVSSIPNLLKGSSKPIQPPRPTAPAAPRPAAPAPLPNAGRAPSGGGGGISYGGGPVAASPTGVISEAPKPAVQSFDEWKAGGGAVGDAAFTAENASAQAEYEALLASLAQQNTSFLNDWNSGMRSMGWNDDLGGWDPNDALGAYGQSFQNQTNDFAGRGLLDSTFYGQANRDLDDRFNRQRTQMVGQRDQANTAYATDKANAQKAREAAQQRAFAEAYSRYASGYGL